MSTTRIVLFTGLSLLAFASNSLLCRIALKQTEIDPASFTSIRLFAGALTLWAVTQWRKSPKEGRGNWTSAFALFVYAIAFSLAYHSLPAGTGALILFAAVQASMISYGLWRGERFHLWQWLGLVIAMMGLVGLLLPGLAAPPLGAAVLMLLAGCAWGVYSLRGRMGGDPSKVSAGNFLRAVPFALGMSVLWYPQIVWDQMGIFYAVVSGAVTSGLGYIIWYSVLPFLRASNAATLQLSVPVIAALGGVLFLGEPLSWRLVAASLTILGGIALVLWQRR